MELTRRSRRSLPNSDRQAPGAPVAPTYPASGGGRSRIEWPTVGDKVAVVEDMLFATLDPTTRRIGLGEGQTVIASDTVGFIHKLPHQLVEAFQATLEEVTRADALLEVVDLADKHATEHRRTVQTVLDELGAGHKPRVVVLNKADRADAAPGVRGPLLQRDDQHVARVSALTGLGVEELRGLIARVLADLWLEIDLAVPYSAGELLARVRERGTVVFEYRGNWRRLKTPPIVSSSSFVISSIIRRH